MMPTPPADLWAQMDAIRNECALIEPPEGAFTTADYAARYDVSLDTGYHDLKKLVKAGKVRKILCSHNRQFYVVTP